MLANKAMLAYVKISQWTARKHDKKATETVTVSHKTSLTAGNYNKKLLPNAHELAEVNQSISAIRTYFYQETLPWFSDGARIISAQNYLKFNADFRKLKNEFENAVTQFIAEYPKLKIKAQTDLGSLFVASDYPSTTDLKATFECELAFMPLPDVEDFRTEIGDAEKKAFIKKMKSVGDTAMRDCWSRLHDTVKRAAETLAKPDAIFRDSLLQNVNEICALLPRLNISDDKELDKKRVEVEILLSGLKPNEMRNDAKQRQNAAAALNKITSSMGAFMGGVSK